MTTNLTEQVASLTSQIDRSPAQFVQSFGLHGYRVGVSRVKTPTTAEEVASKLKTFVYLFNELLEKTEELRRSTPAQIEGEPAEWKLPRLKLEEAASDQDLEQATPKAS